MKETERDSNLGITDPSVASYDPQGSCGELILVTPPVHKGIHMGGVWAQLLGSQETCARFILVLRECIWNAPAVTLILPSFDDTGSLGSPARRVVYPRGFHSE